MLLGDYCIGYNFPSIIETKGLSKELPIYLLEFQEAIKNKIKVSFVFLVVAIIRKNLFKALLHI